MHLHTKARLLVALFALALPPLSRSIVASDGGDDAKLSSPAAAASSDDMDMSPEDFEAIAAKVRQSVVVIRSSNRTGDSTGVGTGFILDASGLVVTNQHVIGEGREFTIQGPKGRMLEPTAVVAVDRRKDLAVIRVNASDLPALELGDSDAVRPGQAVLAVGNPLGFDFSVSKGVIAGRRSIDERGDMIQVAMPIEPGNSGSPLVDAKRRVVGVIAIKSGDAIGFAVASNDLKRLLRNPRPIPIARWRTIGALDERAWTVATRGGTWRQRAGRVVAEGEGTGFGGRMICLSRAKVPGSSFELAVDVKLDDESGAAGLVFHSDGGERHYGFYPTSGSVRLTRFEGPTVFQWTILETLATPHYRAGEWNRVKVRVDDSRITCSVNDETVIEVVDDGLVSGRVGVCKFRSPSAEFRNFRIAAELPTRKLPMEASARVHELASSISPTAPPDAETVDELASLGRGAIAALESRAKSLEEEAFRIRHLAGLVHQRGVERELVEELSKGEADISLVRAALLVAALDNREVDVESYVRLFDRLAAELRERFDAAAGERRHVEQLAEFFASELGFRGSRGEYYHRSNSYINEVLDDREGLPLTLSIVFLELARRVQLPVVGLGVPRHFVVEYRPAGESPRQIIDPFDGARFLDVEALRAVSAPGIDPSDLVPATKRSIIIRMLRNLTNVAIDARDVPSMLRYLDVTLLVDEGAAVERWQRSVLRFQTGQPARAAEDADRLLELGSLELRRLGVDPREVEELRRALRQQGY